MPIITLTSDWGYRDYFLGAVKGRILSRLPEATIVDISHNISPFNLKQASFVVRNAYPGFPKGTVHILALLTEPAPNSPHLVVQYDGQYFIGADNGIFSLIFEHKAEKIVRISTGADDGNTEISARESFIQAATHIASGRPLEELGQPIQEWKEQLHFLPVVSGDVIRGVVIYINQYENVITNITRELVEKNARGRRFSIEFRGETISKISKSYMEVPIGEIAALFGSTGHLEIAINQGNAASLLGLDINDPVRIEFRN